jgi:hypothetical protein
LKSHFKTAAGVLMGRLEIFLVVTCSFLLVTIFVLLRGRRLNEYYALQWIAFGFILVGLTIFRHQIDQLATTLGIQYGPVLVLTVGLLFALMLALHLGLRLSETNEKLRSIAEAVALLEAERSAPPPRDFSSEGALPADRPSFSGSTRWSVVDGLGFCGSGR